MIDVDARSGMRREDGRLACGVRDALLREKCPGQKLQRR